MEQGFFFSLFFLFFRVILWIDNSHMVLSWRSKNTTNVTPVAIFASLLSQRVCALTSIQYCQTSFPKVWYQFISSTSSYKRASFPSVLPTHDITDLWFLANMIAKHAVWMWFWFTFQLGSYTPFMFKNCCFAFSSPPLLIFQSVWSFAYQSGEM